MENQKQKYKHDNYDRVMIFGVPIIRSTMDQSLEVIVELAARHDGTVHKLATANVDFLVNIWDAFDAHPRNGELLQMLRTSAMVCADGMPLVWLSRLLGDPLPERVTGSDLVPMLAKPAAASKIKVYLLGGAPGSANAAAGKLQEMAPDLKVAGVDSPRIDLADAQDPDREIAEIDRQICNQVNNSGADFLLLALGNPKQEIWLERNAVNLRVASAIGIGGTFSFIAGQVKRAPRWMQCAGLEWVYRIYQEPRRLLKRYSVDFVKFNFMVAVLLLTEFAARCGMRRVRPGAWEDGEVLDCAGATYMSGADRVKLYLRWLDSKRPAPVRNVGILLRWQLKAHRLWDMLSLQK